MAISLELSNLSVERLFPRAWAGGAGDRGKHGAIPLSLPTPLDYKFGMVRTILARALVMLFGLWLALAPAVLVMPSAAMAMQTALSDGDAHGGCDSCPEGDADRNLCELVCLSAALLATIPAASPLSGPLHELFRPAAHPAMAGRLSTPDPSPPRS